MRLFLLLSLAGVPVIGAPVSFTNDIAPIFAQKCIACHNEQRARGSFQLHNFHALSRGVKGQPVLVPFKADASTLYQALVTTDEDSRMPQNDDPLPAAQVAIVKQWIEEGAKFDGPDAQAAIKTMVASMNFPDPPTAYPSSIPVLALAFNPEGTELASSGYHEVLIWSTADARLIRRIRSLPQRIQALAYSPDGKTLAIASGTPGRIGQAYLVAGDDLQPMHNSPDVVLAVAFSADGKLLATGGADNTVRVFDLPSARLRFKTEQHADWVLGLAFHPTTSLLVSASRDKTVRLINTINGELEVTYQGHNDAVFAAAFSQDGKRVYSAGKDKKVHAWETKEGKKVGEAATDADVYRLIQNSDDLFICGGNTMVRQYRAADKPELVRSFNGHQDVVYALAFHPGTRRLASGGYDAEVRIWNIDNGEAVATFKATPHTRSAQHLPQGLDTAGVLGRRAD